MPQSAHEYVESQQAEFPPRRPTEEQIKGFADSFGWTPEFAAWLCPDEDYGQILLKKILPGLPAEATRLLEEGRIAVGEIGKNSANAYLETLAGGQYAILFHSGLSEFLYRVARPVAAVLASELNQPGKDGLNIPELARTIAEIFWWYQKTESAFGPGYEISRSQISLASALSTYAEAFLLGHEFGHIFAAETRDWRQGCDTDSLDTREEHVADMAGFLTLLNAVPQPQDLPVACAGAELALQIWHTMAQVGMTFVDGDHPAADERIASLRAMLRRNCSSDEDYDSVTSLASKIDVIFAQVAEIIVDPQEHEVAYERAAGKLVNEFRTLIKRCIGGIVPDYLTFYSEAPSLLSQGYPEVILERAVAQVAREYKVAENMLPAIPLERATRGELSENERQAITQLRNHFHAFKLILGLTKELGGPVADVYLSVLNREMANAVEE